MVVFDAAAAIVCSPGVMVSPASAAGSGAPPVRAATFVYAVTRSAWAWMAAALATSVVPVTMPGAKPVGCASTFTPRLPRSFVCGPAGALAVLATDAPLSTAYVDAVPRSTMGVAAARADGTAAPKAPTVSAARTRALTQREADMDVPFQWGLAEPGG